MMIESIPPCSVQVGIPYVFTEKATVVDFYRLYERLHFRVFKSRGSGARSPEFGQILAPTFCRCVTLGILDNLSECSFLIHKIEANHSPCLMR